MSSLHARRTAKGWMALMATPFYATISEEANPRDPLWCTAEFASYGATKESFCDQFVEDGTITLLFFGTAGTNEEVVLARAEADSKIFFNQRDPTGRLVLEVLNPPAVYGRDTPWCVVAVEISYTNRG